MAQTLSTVSAPASVLLRSSPLVRRLLVLGLVAHLVVAAVCVGWPGGHIGDFTRYWELATSPGRPYLDVAAEYPPGALAVFSLLAGLSRHLADFVLLAQGVNLLADAAIVTTIAWAWGLEAATFYLVASLPLLSLLYFRMDLWSMAAVTGAVACWTRGRGVTSAAALAAGAALKLWPLPFAIILLRGARTSPRPLLAFALLVSAGLGAWVLWSGVDGVLQVLTFRGATGWDIESSVGSLWRLGADAPLRNEGGNPQDRVDPAVGLGGVVPGGDPARAVGHRHRCAWRPHRRGLDRGDRGRARLLRAAVAAVRRVAVPRGGHRLARGGPDHRCLGSRPCRPDPRVSSLPPDAGPRPGAPPERIARSARVADAGPASRQPDLK